MGKNQHDKKHIDPFFMCAGFFWGGCAQQRIDSCVMYIYITLDALWRDFFFSPLAFCDSSIIYIKKILHLV